MVKNLKPRPHAFAMMRNDASALLDRAMTLIMQNKTTQKIAYDGLVSDLEKLGTRDIPSYSAFNRFVRSQVEKTRSLPGKERENSEIIYAMKYLSVLAEKLPNATRITIDPSRPAGRRLLVRTRAAGIKRPS